MKKMQKLECKTTKLGLEYIGTENMTRSCIPCQKWDTDFPQNHSNTESMKDHENYCRNPDGEPEGPWCYTMDPRKRFEYCDVQFCGQTLEEIRIQTNNSGDVDADKTQNVYNFYTSMASYQLFPALTRSIQFSVKACSNAFILLSAAVDLNSPDFYEICLACGYENTKTFLRRKYNTGQTLWPYTPGVINCVEHMTFILRWTVNGKITLTKDTESGTSVVIDWTDPTPLPIQGVGVMTAWGAEGIWIMEHIRSTTAVSSHIKCQKTTTYYTTAAYVNETSDSAVFPTQLPEDKNDSQSRCKCRCSTREQFIGQLTKSSNHNYTNTELKNQMKEELQEITKQLRVQKNLTSAWVRARRSADDQRMTSVGMGYVAIEATKQTNLNDIALFSLQPRCDNNNNGGRIKIFRVNYKISNSQSYYCCILLLLSGDVSINPGPTKFPCGSCGKAVRKNQKGILCDGCTQWFHVKCIELPLDEYTELSKSTDDWYCKTCTLPEFTNSFFDMSKEEESNAPSTNYLPSISDVNNNTGIETDESEYHDIFKDLVKLRRDAPTNIICAYLNINSYRYKFESIIDLLNRNIVDILFLSETKLDDSFPDAMFTVDNFSFYRSDRNKYGGGVLAYMRSDLAGDRNKQAEFQDIESIALEVTTEDNKWLFIGAYKQPSMPDSKFSTDFNLTTDKVIKKYDNVLIMGDLNFNMLDDNKSSTLNDSCDIFCMKNIINKATCYNRNSKPTLLDVILTNQENKCGKRCNFGCGLSDVHNLIGVQIKCERPNIKPKYRKCRSFKNFDVNDFLSDLNELNWDVDPHNNINTEYENFLPQE
ncbi:PLG [Mytilus edulis]|uniref:PLG n=1 Tax=Mytilus edulis TaxID=6550 RepID=A0A8S3U6L6_MYTED|nr:PLG [Mytilus edulis]